MITDTNNKEPTEEEYQQNITIKEKISKTGDSLTTVKFSDLDRDEPHNVVSYFIDYATLPELNNFFVIDRETGELTVRLQNNAVLDYDEGTKVHDVKLYIQDNWGSPGPQYQKTTSVFVYLVDVNDHAPEFKPMTITIPENASDGFTASEPVCAEDKDSGDNGRVSYIIESIVPGN